MSEFFRQIFPSCHDDSKVGILCPSALDWSGLRKDYPYVRFQECAWLSPPGPGFSAYASTLLQEYSLLPPESDVGKGKAFSSQRAYKAHCQALLRDLSDRLYYQALYDDAFALPIVWEGAHVLARYVLGHRWGYVPDGPRPVTVMIVGKCPGPEEAAKCRNFVGRSGLYTRQVLQELGLSPDEFDEWYVTNLCRFPVPESARVVPGNWIKDCLPLLQQELLLCAPRLILAFGNEAIGYFLGRGRNFKHVHGRSYEYTYRRPLFRAGEISDWVEHTALVVPCVHPAAVLRDPNLASLFKKSLSLALNILEGKSSSSSSALVSTDLSVRHYLVSSTEELSRLCQYLSEHKPRALAIDTEFTGPTPLSGQVVSIQFSWERGQAAILALRDESQRWTFSGTQEQIVSLLSPFLEDPDIRLVFHYALADLWWLEDFGLIFPLDKVMAPLDDDAPDGYQTFFGWQKTFWTGPFDTMLAAHAVNETSEFDLKEQAILHTSLGNYSYRLQEWMRANRGKVKESGFGACPRSILFGEAISQTPFGSLVRSSYAGFDADATYRLFEVYNTSLLDCDRFGLCCRIPFWISLRASTAFYEMHKTGLAVDLERVQLLSAQYREAFARLLADFRSEIAWPDFNPSSIDHCRELLFGEEYNGKVDSQTGSPLRLRPAEALSLRLPPYKTTGKRSQLWEKRRDLKALPAADKETLEVLKAKSSYIQKLLDLRYVGQVLRYVLKVEEASLSSLVLDDSRSSSSSVRSASGMLSFLQPDGRLHTKFSQTKKTGRASSWDPPLQNLSKKREPDYQRILGERYTYPLRSVLRARPGHVLISADYTGAELLVMAIQAGDRSMIQHCFSSSLPEKGYTLEGDPCPHGKGAACEECVYPHPYFYDIHSNVAIAAFRPRDPNGKLIPSGRLAKFYLSKYGLKHLRDSAKPVVFGYAYGISVDTAYRRIREVVASVTRSDVESIIKNFERLYPALTHYFPQAAERVFKPGYIVNCFGRYRRIPENLDYSNQSLISALQREFMNFPIQSAIADAMSTAMANLQEYRIAYNMNYRLVLQVHDDVVAEVPFEEAVRYYKEVIPYCLQEKVPIFPTDFDGNLIYDPAAPYHLSPNRSIYVHWGEELTEETARAYGVPEEIVALSQSEALSESGAIDWADVED